MNGDNPILTQRVDTRAGQETPGPSCPAVQQAPAGHAAPAPASPAGRIASIDVLRGFDMFWIIGGGKVFTAAVALLIYPLPQPARESVSNLLKTQMGHAAWEGFTAWDLIMPLFLFIVGAAMPFSFSRRIEAGQGTAAIYRKIATRCLILFVLGMAAQGNLLQFKLSELRLYINVLQTIACGYLIAAMAMLHLRVRGQVLLTAGLLLGYWLVLMLVPVPGHAPGLLEPDLNLARWVDEQVLGHFRYPGTYTVILNSGNYGANVLLGVFAGCLLRSRLSASRKIRWLLVIAGACLSLGWVWSHGSLGAWRFPIIKHLYSSSMVLWAGGWCYLLLAAFYWVIDVLELRRWTFPFGIIGANAIFAYLAVMLVGFRPIADKFVGGAARNLMASDIQPLRLIGELLGPLTGFGILWLILWYFHRNKTFIRV
ncbi:MAG: DUF5009 domain-containing protein [Verrucomicrobia bacterium]|nr:DUF5009 domain-containing protein [Verrucomicrobiota bacterium]